MVFDFAETAESFDLLMSAVLILLSSYLLPIKLSFCLYVYSSYFFGLIIVRLFRLVSGYYFSQYFHFNVSVIIIIINFGLGQLGTTLRQLLIVNPFP